MKRRLIWLTLTMVLVAMAGFVVFLAVTRDPINEANYDKIQIGMAKKEVIAILGRKGKPELILGGDKIFRGEAWYGNKERIQVVFDDQGRVIDKEIREIRVGTENIFD